MRRLEQGLAQFAETRRAQGWTVTYGTPVRGGWPLAARLIVPDLTVDLPLLRDPNRLIWRTERLVLRTGTIRPRVLEIAAEARQSLRIADLAEIPFTADLLQVLAPLEPGVPPAELGLRAENLRAGLPIGGLTVALMGVQGAWKPSAAPGEPALVLSLDAEGITLPPSLPDAAWPLGPRLLRLSLEAALSGPWPRLGHITDRAAQWRDGGGALAVRRLSLVWGPLDLIGSATMALDEQMQPMGAATLRTFGYAETFDALTNAGLLDAPAAEAARAGMGAIERWSDDPGRRVAEVPATLQHRDLAIGRLRLGRIPALPWPSLY